MIDQASEEVDADSQLERLRAALGLALGQTQDVRVTGLDVDDINASLAQAVREIYAVQKVGIAAEGSSERIDRAMDHMRHTLMLLQDVRSENPALTLATGTIARILAMLYPMSQRFKKIEEERRQAAVPVEVQAPDIRPEPIPLTSGQRTAETARPTPISKRGEQAPVRMPAERATGISSAGRTDGIERRTTPRRQIEVDIGIHSGTNFFTGFSQDISSGGLFVATYDVLPIGAKINVNFQLPDGPVLSLDGTVRWVREYNETVPDVEPGMGIQFEDISAEGSVAINRFMEQNQPIFYDND